jgi:thiol-disulfide isomerase/thioredoxin
MNKNNLINFKNIYGEETGIIELKYKDFQINKSSIKIKNNFFDPNNYKGLIIFYAPWCKHCVEISSEFINLAQDNLYIFPMGAVNIEDVKNKNDKLAQKFKIEQIPTVKYVDSKGIIKDYPYNISIENLRYFINMNL